MHRVVVGPLPAPDEAVPFENVDDFGRKGVCRGGAGGGFLRSAAATAAGVAGGALLFQGISSLFGNHYAGGLMSGGMTPGLGETVVNNYYGDDAGGAGGDWSSDAGAAGGGGDWSSDAGAAGGGGDWSSGDSNTSC